MAPYLTNINKFKSNKNKLLSECSVLSTTSQGAHPCPGERKALALPSGAGRCPQATGRDTRPRGWRRRWPCTEEEGDSQGRCAKPSPCPEPARRSRLLDNGSLSQTLGVPARGRHGPSVMKKSHELPQDACPASGQVADGLCPREHTGQRAGRTDGRGA